MFSNFPLLLAPMEDITDSPFRTLCKIHGADILCSEFIASDGLIRMVGKSLDKIRFLPEERPYGVQIFGNNPDVMAEAAQIVASYKPDFIDMNFGCPVKKVVTKGGGAALLNEIPRMLAIAKAVVQSVNLPVTAKTRLGWDAKSVVIETLAEQLQDTGIKALSIHARTKAQLYAGIADWSAIGAVKNNPRIHIPIFGNGDIDSPQKAAAYKNTYGVDGIMIGRASIGNPWLFNHVKHYLATGQLLPEPSLNERIDACIRLVHLASQNPDGPHNLLKLRRHYSGFFKSLPNFKPYRLKLVTSTDVIEITDVLSEIRHQYA